MSHLIPIESARERIGLKDTCGMYSSPRYKPFLKLATKGKRGGMSGALFDIKGYLRHTANIEELIEKSKLFTEYLYHIEGMTYKEMAEITGTTSANISALRYGEEAAYKIVKGFKEKRPYHMKRFHDYYGWRFDVYTK